MTSLVGKDLRSHSANEGSLAVCLGCSREMWPGGGLRHPSSPCCTPSSSPATTSLTKLQFIPSFSFQLTFELVTILIKNILFHPLSPLHPTSLYWLVGWFFLLWWFLFSFRVDFELWSVHHSTYQTRQYNWGWGAREREKEREREREREREDSRTRWSLYYRPLNWSSFTVVPTKVHRPLTHFSLLIISPAR